MSNAIRELIAVLRTWITGDGELTGLLAAWWAVVSGKVRPTDRVRPAEGRS